MENKIDDEKLKKAKEKLACHIEPPKGSPYAEMLAKASDRDIAHEESSCSISCNTESVVSSRSDGIRLTEMTSAGG